MRRGRSGVSGGVRDRFVKLFPREESRKRVGENKRQWRKTLNMYCNGTGTKLRVVIRIGCKLDELFYLFEF